MKIKEKAKNYYSNFKQNIKKPLSIVMLIGFIIAFVGLFLKIDAVSAIGYVLILPYMIKKSYRNLKKNTNNKKQFILEIIIFIASILLILLFFYMVVNNSPYWKNWGFILLLYLALVLAYRIMAPQNLFYLITRYLLFMVVIILIMSSIYIYFEYKGNGYLRFGNCNGSIIENDSQKSNNYIYFSTVTLLSLGYGDICPMGTFFRFWAGFNALLGHLVTVIFISLALRRYFKYIEEEKWYPIKEKALKLIGSTIWDLSTTTLKLFKGTKSITGDLDNLSHEDQLKLFDQNKVKHIKLLANLNKENLTKRLKIDYIKKMDEIFEGGYNGCYVEYQEKIENLELKYGNYLEPNVRLILVELQIILSKLSIYFKWREERELQFIKRQIAVFSKKVFIETQKAIELNIISK